jgi:hypothetical protein
VNTSGIKLEYQRRTRVRPKHDDAYFFAGCAAICTLFPAFAFLMQAGPLFIFSSPSALLAFGLSIASLTRGNVTAFGILVLFISSAEMALYLWLCAR